MEYSPENFLSSNSYMKPGKILEYFMLAFVVIVMNSCATALQVGEMIPHVDYSAFTSTDKTIKVQEVYGGELTNPMGMSKIESKGFQDALVTTLRKSGIFKEVFIDRSGDYELKTQIVSQKMASWLATTNVTLFVHYRLFETKTNKEVWSQSFLSQYDADNLNKGPHANEGAVRDNLTQLLKKLADFMNKLNKK